MQLCSCGQENEGKTDLGENSSYKIICFNGKNPNRGLKKSSEGGNNSSVLSRRTFILLICLEED